MLKRIDQKARWPMLYYLGGADDRDERNARGDAMRAYFSQRREDEHFADSRNEIIEYIWTLWASLPGGKRVSLRDTPINSYTELWEMTH